MEELVNKKVTYQVDDKMNGNVTITATVSKIRETSFGVKLAEFKENTHIINTLILKPVLEELP